MIQQKVMFSKLFIGNVLPLTSDAWDSDRHVHLPHQSFQWKQESPAWSTTDGTTKAKLAIQSTNINYD